MVVGTIQVCMNSQILVFPRCKCDNNDSGSWLALHTMHLCLSVPMIAVSLISCEIDLGFLVELNFEVALKSNCSLMASYAESL